jgi:hypothetical protein
MHPMTEAHTLIREAQDKAERLCALAVAQTPAAYQSFITLIEQRREGGREPPGAGLRGRPSAVPLPSTGT